MAPKPRGKKFEIEIARMLRDHTSIAYARHFPDVGFLNPLDFIGFWQGGRGFVIEAKALKTKSLSFSRFVSKKERTFNEQYGRQWRELEKCANAGVDTFVFVNAYGWPGRDGLRGRAWAVPFKVLADYRASTARKSWPLALFETCDELGKIAGSWEWLEISSNA